MAKTIDLGNVKGPQGAKGEAGDRGPQGIQGVAGPQGLTAPFIYAKPQETLCL